MSGVDDILNRFKTLETEVVTHVDLPNVIAIGDRVARLERIVKQLLESNRQLAKLVAEADASAEAATGEIQRIWPRIDRLERHLLDFMKAEGRPSYWYLDPQ